MRVRTGQALHAFRKLGVVGTLRKAAASLAKESISIPWKERIWLSKYGFKPISYVLYDFAKKSQVERLKYVPDSAALLLKRINEGPSAFISNRLVFHRMLERNEADVKAPELMAVLGRGQLLDPKPPYSVMSLDELSTRGADFFVKPLGGGRGVGIRRVSSNDIESIKDLIDQPGIHLIVRTIEQADYSRRIFAQSSNTVRAVAMRSPGSREVFIPRAVHRFGSVGTGPVDNWSQGGVSCEINSSSGALGGGIRHPSVTGGNLNTFEKHPDTGAQLTGTIVPRWNEALDLVRRLMNTYPDLEFAGWDLLLARDGWYVIEGNSSMDIDLIQIHGGLLQDSRVRQFMRHHHVI